MQELQQAASVQQETGYGTQSEYSNMREGGTDNTNSSQNGLPLNQIIEDRSKTAINLIHYDPASKNYVVSEEAREFLKGIKEKVAVIAVAGKYRTGKSFLLNRVILNKRASGFGVGPTINPCTKGLWVWSECLETMHNGEKMRILVVDSEGIGAFDEDVNHDTKIFLLALLLCSTFIFNSMNTIDENAINSLSLIINLSKELQVKKSESLGESDPEDIQKFFPSFLWVVRDFSLRLIDTYGNTINQKQYLENALQPQKGSSDAVEQKNRIRRMIQLFFKDRDCFTMVRPVENEKELQNLQQMTDDQFRPEFQQQLVALRSRIMKKAKPKVLNNRILTGEMLYELCVAYTDAINKGSVPNIQNAWSYVCQNECQRTISACIANYEQKIKDPYEEAKLKLDLTIFKAAHSSLMEQCAHQFRKDAMGGQDAEGGQEMIQELEFKLRNQLQEKYKGMKKDFIRICKIQAKKYLDEQTQEVRRGITQHSFESLDQVQDKLEQIKNEYEGPRYPGFEVLLSETICQLILKASEYFNMNQSQSSQFEKTRLTAKVQDLEEQLKQARIDHQTDRSDLQSNLAVIQAENAQLVKSEKLMQERSKIEQVESQNYIQKKEKEYHNEIDIKEKEIQSLKHQLDIIDLEKRQTDSSQNKKFTELEKLNALIEQKLILTEQDLNDHKKKLSEKDQDHKELQKEHYQVRIEVQDLKQQISRKQIDHDEEMSKQREQNEKDMAKLQDEMKTNKDGVVTQAPQMSIENAKWKKEREQMTKQINIMTEQFDQQKKLQESLLQALNREKNPTETTEASDNSINTSPQFIEMQQKNQSLLQMNNNLSQQIVQMQNKQQQLEEDIRSLKKYKKIVNNSVALQCKFCGITLQKENFQDHIKTCSQDTDKSRVSLLLPTQNVQQSHQLQSSQRMHQPRNSGMVGIGIPSPMTRQRASTIGRNANQFGSISHIQAQNIQHQISIQSCEIMSQDPLNLQNQSTFNEIIYTIEIQSIDQYEWIITKNLQEIDEFLKFLKKTYSTFDFIGHGISLSVNPPQNSSEEIQFYFENVLKFEVQQLIEKLQKIPFIREGQGFRSFFDLDKQHHSPAIDGEGQELEDVEIEADMMKNIQKHAKKDRAAEMLNQIKALSGAGRLSPEQEPFTIQHLGSNNRKNESQKSLSIQSQQNQIQQQQQQEKQPLANSYMKHKFNLNLKEQNLEEQARLATDGTNVQDELADSCGDLDDKDRFKEVIASFRHDNSSRLQQRPVSNRYNQGALDDDLDPTLERDSVIQRDSVIYEAKQIESMNYYDLRKDSPVDYRKDQDSANILCQTQESLGYIRAQKSPKHRLFKNIDDRPTSKQANHEIQSRSNYFNDSQQHSSLPYNDNSMEHSKFLNHNLHDEDLNDRADQFPQTARQFSRKDSTSQIVAQVIPSAIKGASRNNNSGRQLQSYNDRNNQTPLNKKQLDEDENVLSSQGTIEEQQSAKGYVNDLQTYTSHGHIQGKSHHNIPDIKLDNINNTSNSQRQMKKQRSIVDSSQKQSSSLHQKVSSISNSSQSGFIRTGTQRAAYLGSVPNHQSRGPVPKHTTSSISGQRGSLKPGLGSSKKILNPTMSASAISSSASMSKSRQKSTKMMGLSTVSGYEPHHTNESGNKKHSSISYGSTHMQRQTTQTSGKSVNSKYLSPVLRQGGISAKSFKN